MTTRERRIVITASEITEIVRRMAAFDKDRVPVRSDWYVLAWSDAYQLVSVRARQRYHPADTVEIATYDPRSGVLQLKLTTGGVDQIVQRELRDHVVRHGAVEIGKMRYQLAPVTAERDAVTRDTIINALVDAHSELTLNLRIADGAAFGFDAVERRNAVQGAMIAQIRIDTLRSLLMDRTELDQVVADAEQRGGARGMSRWNELLIARG